MVLILTAGAGAGWLASLFSSDPVVPRIANLGINLALLGLLDSWRAGRRVDALIELLEAREEL